MAATYPWADDLKYKCRALDGISFFSKQGSSLCMHCSVIVYQDNIIHIIRNITLKQICSTVKSELVLWYLCGKKVRINFVTKVKGTKHSDLWYFSTKCTQNLLLQT